MRKTILAAAALAVLAATPALAVRPAVCIRQDDIRNWTSLDDKHLVLENYHHQKALLKLIGTCTGFKFAETLVIRSPGGTALSCVSPGDEVHSRQLGGFNGRCAVVSVDPYTAPPKPQGGGDQGGDSH